MTNGNGRMLFFYSFIFVFLVQASSAEGSQAASPSRSVSVQRLDLMSQSAAQLVWNILVAAASSKGGKKEIRVSPFFTPAAVYSICCQKVENKSRSKKRSKCHKNLFIKGDGRVESGCGGSGQINYSQSQSWLLLCRSALFISFLCLLIKQIWEKIYLQAEKDQIKEFINFYLYIWLFILLSLCINFIFYCCFNCYQNIFQIWDN